MEISKAQSLSLPSRSSCHGIIPTTAGSCVLKGERFGHRMTPILFLFFFFSLSFSTLVIYGANSTFNVCGFKLVVTRQHNEGSHACGSSLFLVCRGRYKRCHWRSMGLRRRKCLPPRRAGFSGRLRFHTRPPLGSRWWWWCYRFLFHPLISMTTQSSCRVFYFRMSIFVKAIYKNVNWIFVQNISHVTFFSCFQFLSAHVTFTSNQCVVR